MNVVQRQVASDLWPKQTVLSLMSACKPYPPSILMSHVRGQTTVTTVLPSTVLLCGTPYRPNCVWICCHCVLEMAENVFWWHKRATADMAHLLHIFEFSPYEWLLTPRLLGVYYFFVVDSVCLFVTLLQIDSSSLFLDGIEPFRGHQFSMTKATKRCSSNFDLLPWQRNLGYFFKKIKLLLLFCFTMESSHFLAISSPWTPLQNVVLRFLI